MLLSFGVEPLFVRTRLKIRNFVHHYNSDVCCNHSEAAFIACAMYVAVIML